MNEFNQRLNEVENHLQHNDLDLGYRRLIDCVLDLGEKSFTKRLSPIQIFITTKILRTKIKQRKLYNWWKS